MTMQTQNPNVAHSLYVLYETLSDEAQQLFLQELSTKQRHKVESVLKKSSCDPDMFESALLSESALAEDWLKAEEDTAWLKI
ncbi:MAG: hypothetical protein KJ725_00655 [Gammaproteobacteria bacterium]|uniref:hypothetical protein n=1 Tax=Methylotuvimicrobium sp. TaxID=2822413 RepID=UPI001D42F566|nr:hypothetical protein [Gammaproteobacteria bacterium]